MEEDAFSCNDSELSAHEQEEDNYTHIQPDDEFTELREMMKDLQVGFSAAMTELSKIQGEDRELHDKLDNSKREQDIQMKDVYDLVQKLKTQCDDIQYQIEVSNKNQKKMEKQIKKIKSERLQADLRGQPTSLTLDNLKDSSYSHPDSDNPAYTTSPMLKSFIASLPLPEDMEEIEDHHSDSDESLVAVTQKSIRLSNILAQKAFVNNLSSRGGNNQSDRSSILSSEHQQDYPNGVEQLDTRANTQSQPLSRAQVQRRKIAIGIVEEERSFCTTLYNIKENYCSSLNNSGGLSVRDSSRIFPPSLTVIYEYHCDVLKRLENRLLHWNQQDVLGDIFGKFSQTKHVDIFAQYRDYIDNFPNALRSIRKLNKTSERFRSTLKVCQRETGGDKLSLVNHLLAPVRRMPSYVLYIKRLLKYTDMDHPDRYFLESSLSMFRSNLLSMNEAMERTIQIAVSDSGSSKQSVETCSWSSHEEDQRLSTATKDSGIHSNCDLDSHDDELSALHYKRREPQHCGHDSDSSYPRGEVAPRPKSMLDFTRLEHSNTISSLPRRSKTPTPGLHNYESKRTSSLKPSLSHSTPNLLDDFGSDTLQASGSLKQKTKHKVHFKNLPDDSEQRSNGATHHSKRIKKRSITDTLRIFFNKRKGTTGRHSNSDMSDSCCDLNSSMDEAPRPAPPQMFANNNSESARQQLPANMESSYLAVDTFEDENGDPYSVV